MAGLAQALLRAILRRLEDVEGRLRRLSDPGPCPNIPRRSVCHLKPALLRSSIRSRPRAARKGRFRPPDKLLDLLRPKAGPYYAEQKATVRRQPRVSG